MSEFKRFENDTAKHEMTVKHDNGLYRHLRFQKPGAGFYWFELVTWPGSLAIRADMGSYTFSRLTDMFEFFRGDHGINPQYWAEKLQADSGVKEYSEDLFRQLVIENFVEAVKYGGAPRGLGKAVREEILTSEETYYEEGARAVLNAFKYKDFQFTDTWEWPLYSYTHRFLWCCHAIQWGIGQYDSKRVAA